VGAIFSGRLRLEGSDLLHVGVTTSSHSSSYTHLPLLKMPMRLRFALHGVKHKQIMHLVAVNSRARRDAKPAELLGVYNPLVNDSSHKTMQWSVDRIKYWLSVGAIPSQSVVKLLEIVRILFAHISWHRTSVGQHHRT
jgi:small subunit ribosomal protein S16